MSSLAAVTGSNAHPAWARIVSTPWMTLTMALGSGALTSLAFPGWDLALLAWVSMVPFLMLLMTPRSARAYVGISCAFGCGFFGGLNYWLLAMHPLTWIGPHMTVALSLFIVFLAWSCMALTLSVGAIAMLTPAALVMRSLHHSRRLAATGAILVPVCFWVSMEYLQAHGAFGYSWGMLAATQYKTLPLLQVIALVGSFPLSGLIVGVNAGIAWGLLRREWKGLATMLTLVVLASGFGAWWINRPLGDARVPVAVVQGNISQTEKWQKGNEKRIADQYFNLSNAAASAQLIVWPESAIPLVLSSYPSLYDRFSLEARLRKQYLLTGTFNAQYGARGQVRYYNATTMFSPTGQNLGFDAKKHLVPFGEYLPGRNSLPPFLGDAIKQLNLFPVDLTPGERAQPFHTEFGAVGTNVCFDSIFPDVMRATANAGAQVFVLVTNDGWYKHTTAMQQHLAHGVLRAVENRRAFLQAANTGSSAIVAPTGRIQALGRTWESAVVEANITPISELTPYTRFGDWLTWLMMAGALSMIGWSLGKGRKKDA